MSGRNCFRERWTERPLYSGGKVCAFATADGQRRFLAMAFGATVNVVSATDGRIVASYDAPLDDLVLHIDCTAAVPDATASDDDEDNDATTIGHLAFSTQELQVFVLALRIVTDSGAEHLDLALVKNWVAAQHAIGCLKFSAAGTHIASGATDGGLKMWDVHHHHLTHNYRGEGGVVTAIAFSPDQALFAAGTFEGYVSLIDFESKQVLGATRLHTAAVDALSFLEDGALVTVGRDRKVAVHDPRTLTQRRAVVVRDYFNSAAFVAPRSLYLGTTTGGVTACEVGADDATVVKARLAAPPTPTEEEHSIQSVAFLPRADPAEGDAPYRVLAADASQRVHCIDVSADRRALTRGPILYGFFDQILDLVALPAAGNAVPEAGACDRLVVSNSRDVAVLGPRGALGSHMLAGHSDIVLGAALSADGRWIVTGSKDCTVRVWDRQSFECVAIGAGHEAEVAALALNPKMGSSSSFFAATVSADEALRLWDLRPAFKATATAVADLKSTSTISNAHAGPVHCVAVAPNDQLVATGGKDKVVTLWGVGQGGRLQKQVGLTGHRRPVNCVAFSPVDRLLASGCNEGTVKIWALAAHQCVKTLQCERIAVTQVRFFNRGQQIATGTSEGLLRVWALAAGECVADLSLHGDKLWALQVLETEDSTVMLAGGADACMTCVEDYTDLEAARIKAEKDEALRQEQRLANALRKGDYAAAFRLALKLNHQRHLKMVITRWLAASTDGCEDGIVDLFGELPKDDVRRLLEFTREWLTNARNCSVAAVVITAMLRAHHYAVLQRMRPVQEAVEALWAYSKRHHARLSATQQQLHYIDYLARSMDGIGGALRLDDPTLALVEDTVPVRDAPAEETKPVAAAEPAAAPSAKKTQPADVEAKKRKAKRGRKA